MTEVVPTAQGSLEATPLGHLLVYSLDRSLTGTLVLEEGTGSRHAIYFEAGAPSKAKLHEPSLFLGRILRENEGISEAVYERTRSVAALRGVLHGRVLLEEGELDEHTLREALREQLSRQVLRLFELPASTLFGYYDRLNFLERWGGPGVPARPLALIWRGVREHVNAAHVADVLGRYGDQPILLHQDAPIRRFDFEPREQSIIDVLRAKPQPLHELLGRGLAAEAHVRRLIYVLIITRQLETGIPGMQPIGAEAASSTPPPTAASPRPPGSAPAARAVSPAARAVSPAAALSEQAATPSASSGSSPHIESPELMAFKTEIRERAANGSASYYDLLGVAPDAMPSVIQASFFQLAKKWHPDRLSPNLVDVRDLATKVFARMSEAHQILSDPTRRNEYDELRKGGGGGAGEQEEVQRVVRAATAFQKAEVLMRRNNNRAALDEARRAVELDPTQADYIALLAWVESSHLNANLEDILARIEKALRLEPNNTRIRWYRGSLLKRLGKTGKAVGDFRFVVENDPRHVDAQREIRLYDMRKAELKRTGQRSPSDRPSGQPAPNSSIPPGGSKPNEGGRFGKWFKR